MDNQIKAHLEAIGARYAQLAATQPDLYIQTRFEEDDWRIGWMTEHEPEIRGLEQQVAVRRMFAIRDVLSEAVKSGSAAWTDPVSPSLQAMFPGAITVGDWMNRMVDMMDNALMEEMTEADTR